MKRKTLLLSFQFTFVTKESMISVTAKKMVLPAGIDLVCVVFMASQLMEAVPCSVCTMAGHSETVLRQLQAELDICSPGYEAVLLQIT